MRGQQNVVLKLAGPGQTLSHERLALMQFEGFGAVPLLAASDNFLLMPKVQPGTALSETVLSGNDDDATVIITQVASRLHRAPLGADMRPIPTWHARYDRHAENAALQGGLYERARLIYEQLSQSQSDPVTLHGDLHHDNILLSANRGWIAIDPKGYVGQPEYEFGALLRNPTKDPRHYADPRIVSQRLETISRLTNYTHQRLLCWAFAQAVLSALWSLEDGLDPLRGLSTANAIAPLL